MVCLLARNLALVELPVLVDRDGLAAVDKCLDLGDERFPSSSDTAPDILAPICSVVGILGPGLISDVSRFWIHQSRGHFDMNDLP